MRRIKHSKPRSSLAVGLSLLALLASRSPCTAADQPETSSVFAEFSPAVVRIQVVETGSGAKAVVGTGFVADEAGHVVTNFHVVAKLVHEPGRYRAEYSTGDGRTGTLELRAFDAVHDLAITSPGLSIATPLVLEATLPAQGTRLYSLGYPHDIGLSIVEGTFNGLLEHSLYEKIHFSGAINSGMSGGPTIDANGHVIGVNVSSAGNDVGFLVPAARVQALFARMHSPGFETPGAQMAELRQQLLDHQEAHVSQILSEPLLREDIGPFSLPGKAASFFRCWGDAERTERSLHEVVTHECSTEDRLFISDKQYTGTVSYRHHVITTDELDPFRFHSLYSQHFGSDYGEFSTDEDAVTGFRCETGIIAAGEFPMKIAFCVQGYRKLAGLYDVVVKTALLGDSSAGVETSIAFAGVSYPNAVRLTERLIGAIQWKR